MNKNIKFVLPILIAFLISLMFTQCKQGEYDKEIATFRLEQDEFFFDPEKSPLTAEGLADFNGLEYFPADKKYKIEAEFILTPDAASFMMSTTTDRIVDYRKYGKAVFNLSGEKHELSIYRNQQIKDKEEYKDHLFLPYKDLTNGNLSYGGGRYIDLKIPESNTITIDFNKSYNPYCAYNHRYSCPIPPDENHLNIEIRAGVKKYDH